MKQVYLVRHAKSSWKQAELRDFDRPLNKRGKEDAKRMALWLKALDTFQGPIYTSPAMRALSTAKQMAQKLSGLEKLYENPALYTFSDDSVYEETIWSCPESFDQLMMVGHNEIISEVAHDYCDGPVDRMVTCGIVCLEFPVNAWSLVTPGTGKLKFQVFPKMFK